MSTIAYAMPIRTPLPKRRGTTRAEQGRVKNLLPTLELMRQKALVLGGRINRKGQPVGFDMHGSTWPLDVYLSTKVIEPRHHKAGMRYAFDRHALFGPVTLERPGAAENGSPELTDDEREWIAENRTRRLREATTILQHHGAWFVVRLVVLDGLFVPNRDDQYRLRLGLQALAREWRITDG